MGTAIRQGARSVRQLEIMPRPPETRAADNPWPEWPKVYKLDYGQEEAKALWGEDPRRYSTTTRRFIGRNEHVTGIEIADIVVGSRGRTGGPRCARCRARPRCFPADLVLLALGFTGPEPALPKAFGCELDPRGNVRTGPDRMTTVPGVFAAGDCVRGQSLVVWAIREGRTAAAGRGPLPDARRDGAAGLIGPRHRVVSAMSARANRIDRMRHHRVRSGQSCPPSVGRPVIPGPRAGSRIGATLYE